MKRRSLAGRGLHGAAIVAGSLVVLAGCGSGTRSPRLSSLPLVPGARVVTDVHRCDSGANAYCALELVVVDPRYGSPRQLVMAEGALLRAHGWTGASPQTGDEQADESPGHKYRITYATAYGDLKGIDLGWITRTRKIQESLSNQLFAGATAMSAELQIGSQ